MRRGETILEYPYVVALAPAQAPTLPQSAQERLGILRPPPLQLGPLGPAERLRAPLQPHQLLPRVG